MTIQLREVESVILVELIIKTHWLPFQRILKNLSIEGGKYTLIPVSHTMSVYTNNDFMVIGKNTVYWAQYNSEKSPPATMQPYLAPSVTFSKPRIFIFWEGEVSDVTVALCLTLAFSFCSSMFVQNLVLTLEETISRLLFLPRTMFQHASFPVFLRWGSDIDIFKLALATLTLITVVSRLKAVFWLTTIAPHYF